MSVDLAAVTAGPIALARDRLLEVVAPLQPLLPEGGLRRGSTVVISAPASGATTLAVALLAGVSRGGGWGAIVGLPALGVGAAAQLGVDLDRLALVPAPGEQWPVVAAALLDSMDAIVLAAPPRPRPRDARRLAARARERGAVMAVVGDGWPEREDVHLEVAAGGWVGPGAGDGYVRARRAEVVVSGRGAAARARRVPLWLPGPDGTVAAAAPVAVTTEPVRWHSRASRLEAHRDR